jgi:hypothetical protein
MKKGNVMQPINNQANPVIPQVPKQLKSLMEETLTRAIPSLHIECGYEKLKELFKNHILKSPFDDTFIKNTKIDENTLLGKDVVYLHKLYNNPDSSLVSNINQDPLQLQNFQSKIIDSYKLIKKTVKNLPQKKEEEKAKAPEKATNNNVDLSKFEPEAKKAKLSDTDSDEQFARELQEKFNNEKGEETHNDSNHNSTKFIINGQPVNFSNQPNYINRQDIVFANGQRITTNYDQKDNIIERIITPNKTNNFNRSFISSNISFNPQSFGSQSHQSTVFFPPQNSVSQSHNQNGGRKVSGDSEETCNIPMHGKIEVESGAKNKKIKSDMHAKTIIGDNCSDIAIRAEMHGKIEIGRNCSAIKIKAEMHGRIEIENNCSDIRINGEMYNKVVIGDNCSNINISQEMYSDYSIGKNCREIYVNGRKVA